MNVNFTKLISSATAVLAVISSAYAQDNDASSPAPKSPCCPAPKPACCPAPKPVCCPPPKPVCCPPRFEQGYELNCDKIPAAYNAPARFDVQCSWDFFVSGSFTYWHASQDGMEIAIPAKLSPDLETLSLPQGQPVIIQKFQYKPGFKVGLGMNFEYDNWIGYTEYTWFRSKTVTSGSAYNYLPWFYSDFGNAFQSEWKLHMDILDTYISRPFYSGRYLTIQPFGGIRAAWIRQFVEIQNIGFSDILNVSTNRSHVWSVGPSAGLNAHWLLGWGFRFEGDVNGSLLYTRYSKVSARDFDQYLRLHQYAAVRPNAGMNVGLGWGSYFDCGNYHVDLLTTYDFNVFLSQNMMRSLIEADGYDAGSLQLHGLTFTARFDF